ncbi:MAG: PhzF family phenazine biosynthesis protein [Vicinamibacteraceae bacterium]|nr:PhzF family phenazine biosynthesis protein [Vicinamibacteraceae bacterium]
MHRFLHLDVFTDTPLTGNQLAVFTAPSHPFNDGIRQAIAREMAFSETVFVEPPSTPGALVRLRIFTPARELPMAGHPTVGSAFALAHEGVIAPGTTRVVFDLGVGPLPIDLEWDDHRLAFAWMTQPRPEFGPEIRERARLASALGVREDAVAPEGPPPQVVSTGVPFLFVPLATRADVDSCVVDVRAMDAACRLENLPTREVFVFTTERAADDGATVYSRMFAPALGVAEDPATGSACGPLGAYLVRHRLVSPEQAGRLVSLQGVKMQRASRIHISIGTDGDAITSVRVGGTAVLVAEATLHLPV